MKPGNARTLRLLFCHSERSEESSGIRAPIQRVEAPAGFFAALRMTMVGVEGASSG
jgi:hypothetical protein